MDRPLDRHLGGSEQATTDRGDRRIDFGPLAELAGFLLRLAQLRVFETFFTEFGQRGITPGQIGILFAVKCNPGIRQGVLAEALLIKRANMAKIVRALATDGLIERRVPVSDRRAVEMRLSRAGHDLVERLLPEVRVHDRGATTVLTRSEREVLTRLLQKMTGAVALGQAPGSTSSKPSPSTSAPRPTPEGAVRLSDGVGSFAEGRGGGKGEKKHKITGAHANQRSRLLNRE